MAAPKYLDGFYKYNEVVLDQDFNSEKELCAYIENNISLFVADCLGYQLKKYKRESVINEKYSRTDKNNRRIDFIIETTCGKRIGIECKRPLYKSELSNAIGQCLAYLALFEQEEKPLDSIIIVSTQIDNILPLVIHRFNLPIGFIAFDKTKFLTLQKR